MDLIFRLPFHSIFFFSLCVFCLQCFTSLCFLRERTLQNTELLLLEHASWTKLWTDHSNREDSIDFPSPSGQSSERMCRARRNVFFRDIFNFSTCIKSLIQRIGQPQVKTSTVWVTSHHSCCPRSGTRETFSELVCLLRL